MKGGGFKALGREIGFRRLIPFLDDWHRLCVSKTRESGGCDPWDWDWGDKDLAWRRR